MTYNHPRQRPLWSSGHRLPIVPELFGGFLVTSLALRWCSRLTESLGIRQDKMDKMQFKCSAKQTARSIKDFVGSSLLCPRQYDLHSAPSCWPRPVGAHQYLNSVLKLRCLSLNNTDNSLCNVSQTGYSFLQFVL